MSYILEALRRAEAERQRGAVPGLHAQPASGALADAGRPPLGGAPRPWPKLVLAAAVLFTVVAGVVWLWLQSAPAPSVPDQVVAPLVIAPPALPVTAPAGPPASSSALAAAAPLPVPRLTPPRSAALPALVPKPPAAAPSAVAARPLPPPAPSAAAVTAVTPLPAQPPAVRGASPSAPAARLSTLAELPEALRREIQPLSLGGSVYAEHPAQRIVIVNGQVFHEGDRLNGELQVQEIRLKSVVFSLRGQRFEVPL